MATTEIPFESLSCILQVNDNLLAARKQECNFYRRDNFVSTKLLSDCIMDRQRTILWLYSVGEAMDLRRELVAIAAYYLDVSLEKGVIQSYRDVQLCAMTALRLAFKLHDSKSKMVSIPFKLDWGLFSHKDTVEMEIKMLEAMKWHVHPPTPTYFIQQYLQKLSPSIVQPFARHSIVEIARYICELSVCLNNFVRSPPSVIAYSSILIAIERIEDLDLHVLQRQQILECLEVEGMDYGCHEILECFGELEHSLQGDVGLQTMLDVLWYQGVNKLRCGSSLDRSSEKNTKVLNKNDDRLSPCDCRKYPI